MNALLISPDGHCRPLTGAPPSDPAVLGVLAQGALAALADLGLRSGQGPCLEINVTHAQGGTYLLPQADGGLVMLQYGPDLSLDEVRAAMRPLRMAAAPPPPPAPAPPAPAAPQATTLGDALNTML